MNSENFNQDVRRRWEERMERHRHGHVWTGVFLLIIGALALVKSYGTPMPVWLFSWQMLLIAIGLFIGLKKGFRDGGWFIPVFIGSAFLLNDFFLHGELRKHIWPLILIIIGAFFIFRPRHHGRRWQRWREKKNVSGSPEVVMLDDDMSYSEDDLIDVTSIFGGTKKMILSKNFKGGDMVNVFGGSELDLTQADINGTAILEVTAIFGGAKLVIPSHWVLKSEATTIFGGIDDKRKNVTVTPEKSKALILRGTVLFGGIEIKSY